MSVEITIGLVKYEFDNINDANYAKELYEASECTSHGTLQLILEEEGIDFYVLEQ